MKLNLAIAGIITVVGIQASHAQATSQVPLDNGPSLISGVGAEANFAQTFNHQVGSMRFVGKVVVAGSKLPWEPISVVLKCDGKTRFTVLTNTKGEFYIEASSRESEAVETMRDPKRVDPAQLVGCKVNAVLEGFESTSLTIMNGSIMDNPDVGTVILRTDERAAGFSESKTTQAAPPEAQKEFEAARGDNFNRHPRGALRHLRNAVNLDPQFAEAWYQLGRNEEKDKPQDALSAYRKSAAADSEYIPPYERIAALAAAQKNWQEVADAARRALLLNPVGTAQIWYWNAVGNYNLGETEAAETSALTALSMDTRHVAAPKTEHLLAVILVERGEVKGALEHLRNWLAYTPAGPEADLVKEQVEQLEKVVRQRTQRREKPLERS